jgi:hypothetical protein
MKKFIVLATMAAFVVGALAVGAFAADPTAPMKAPVAQVRIVNLSAVKGMTYNDKNLMTLANLDVSKNTKIFPIVSDFAIMESGKEYAPGTEIPCEVVCPINISSSIKEGEKLEFASVTDLTTPAERTPKEFNIAVVGSDGSVDRISTPADIDYSKKVFKTDKPIPLADGDTVLVFVRDVPKIYFDYQGLEENKSFVFPY